MLYSHSNMVDELVVTDWRGSPLLLLIYLFIFLVRKHCQQNVFQGMVLTRLNSQLGNICYRKILIYIYTKQFFQDWYFYIHKLLKEVEQCKKCIDLRIMCLIILPVYFTFSPVCALFRAGHRIFIRQKLYMHYFTKNFKVYNVKW